MEKNSRKNNISNYIYSKKDIKKMEDKVLLLGVNNKINPLTLLNVRLISTIAIFGILLYFLEYGYIIAPLVAGLFYILFVPMFIDTKLEKRRIELEKEAMYFFEILALSLEAGRNIKTSIEITCNNIDGALSDEFKKLLKDIRYGMNLNDALEELKFRIPSDTICNIILNIKEANIFGNNIIETMFSQIDYIREKRILEQKAKISKMPVKISIVSVIFFIPLLMLVLLAPMLINMLG